MYDGNANMNIGVGQPSREKGTELYEIIMSLNERGQRFEKLASRLNIIGSRLFDDSHPESKSVTKDNEPLPYPPGHLSSLHTCAKGFEVMADRIEREISKLEKFI